MKYFKTHKYNSYFLLIIGVVFIYSCSKKKTNKNYYSPQPTNEKVNPTQDTVVFLDYGELPPTGFLQAGNPITELYGFRLVSVAGCEITHELADSVHLVNRKSMGSMNKLYGKDWQEKFEKETHYKLSIPLK